MATHTPGPWHANVPQDERYADGSTIREAHHGDIIATVARPLLAKGDVIANARLIAAAPDLLAQLQRLHNAVLYLTKITNVPRHEETEQELAGSRSLLARLA